MTARKGLVVSLFVWAVLAWTGTAGATILTFDGTGNIIHPYGDNVSGPATGYLEGDGWTPNITATLHQVNPTTFVETFNYLIRYATNYGDLINIAYANNGQLAEIMLTPAAGYLVVLNSFDLGGWNKADRPSQTVRVLDVAGNVLWGSLLYNQTILGSGPTHSAFAPGLTSDEAIRIQFGNSINVGIDNVNFSQTAEGGAPVPEPATMLLLGAGLVGLAGFKRARTKRKNASSM